jgi:sterol desaturase/sphingolipid hydroxylase (fatty acid hydroxylase superfamily)
MPSVDKFIKINTVFYLMGYLYYLTYKYKSILHWYLYCTLKNFAMVIFLNRTTRNYIRLSDKRHEPNMSDFLNILMVGWVEILTILFCNKTLNTDYELLTFIPVSFVFEIVFDFFHYWTHRICHTKYLYFIHKKHHEHTINITELSTFHQEPLDLLLTNFVPMYLTSYLIPFSELQFMIFLIYKVYIEISGHLGIQLNISSFAQCTWLPRLFNIELYSEDHFLHHKKFKCNYSKRFVLWDKAFDTYNTEISASNESPLNYSMIGLGFISAVGIYYFIY